MFMWIADAPDMQAPDWATACIITAASAVPSPAPPCFRHADAEPAALGHGPVELVGEPAVAVAREPVLVPEGGAEAPHPFLYRTLRLAQRELHAAHPSPKYARRSPSSARNPATVPSNPTRPRSKV